MYSFAIYYGDVGNFAYIAQNSGRCSRKNSLTIGKLEIEIVCENTSDISGKFAYLWTWKASEEEPFRLYEAKFYGGKST